ncbi:helix-turn-helix domain-containing protein [Streptomyces sp. Inha503]|uniref:helix-turn-helix domain-containing protein n=1 Tax=Streptomyces sp. Inha503 TaxID=3383314 RepID=UPI0039A05B1B
MKEGSGRWVQGRDHASARSFRVLVCSFGVDLPSRALPHLSGLLAGRRRHIGCRWCGLICGRQVLLVLAPLRCGDAYACLAAGFGVGVTAVCRCIREAVDLLAARAPALEQVADRPHHRRPALLLGREEAPRYERAGPRGCSRPSYPGLGRATPSRARSDRGSDPWLRSLQVVLARLPDAVGDLYVVSLWQIRRKWLVGRGSRDGAVLGGKHSLRRMMLAPAAVSTCWT